MVIFGAGGDLTRRLVVPALYNLSRTKVLPGSRWSESTSRRQPLRAGAIISTRRWRASSATPRGIRLGPDRRGCLAAARGLPRAARHAADGSTSSSP